MFFWNAKTKKKPTKKLNKKKGTTYRKEFPIIYKSYFRRTVLSASMTLEATFIIPLIVFFTLMLIYVVNLVNFQNQINETMYNSARTLSKLEYLNEGSANIGSASALIIQGVGNNSSKDMRIIGGVLGISPIESDFSGDYVNLQVNYVARLPFDFLGIIPLNCSQRSYTRKWIGNEDKGDSIQNGDNKTDRLVYITETGSVYHEKRDCTYLKLSIRSVDTKIISEQRNIEGGKYYPCEVCDGRGSILYITDTGNRYHGNINCSGIKRGIITIPLSQVGGRPPCTRCGDR